MTYNCTNVTATDAEAILDAIMRAKAERDAKYPDEKACLSAITDAVHRLKDLGWSDVFYCPKDGSTFEVIEAGSSGIHRCHYSGTWPDGTWWVRDNGDLWPSRPILYRRIKVEVME